MIVQVHALGRFLLLLEVGSCDSAPATESDDVLRESTSFWEHPSLLPMLITVGAKTALGGVVETLRSVLVAVAADVFLIDVRLVFGDVSTFCDRED